MRPQTVIVPLDGTEHALAALPVARSLADALGATLHVVHVRERALPSRAILRELGLRAEDVHGSIVDQRTGRPGEEILRLAATQPRPLLVICTHTGAEKPRGALGSAAEHVLVHAPCGVVLVEPERGCRPWSLRRILLPHDGTPTTAAAMDPAGELAELTGAEVLVLYVATPGAPPPAEPGAFTAPRYLDQPQHEWPAWASEFLGRMCALGHPPSEVRFELAMAAGEPCEEIVRLAREQESDLVVLAWHGVWKGEHARTMKGVIHDTPCPLLVVRAHEPAAQGPGRGGRRGGAALAAAVFDLDGVVTLTATAHRAAWKEVFDAFLRARAARTGEPFLPFTDADYAAHVDGRPRREGIRTFLASRNIALPEGSPADPAGAETVEGLAKLKARLFLERLRTMGVMVDPEAVRLIRELRAAGVRVGLASSSRNVAAILETAGLEELFDACVDGVASEELGLEGKPEPDIFLETLRRLGTPDPGRALLVEDSAPGVEAGRRAGFALVIGVARGGDAATLRAHGADWVLGDLRGVSAEEVFGRVRARERR